MAQWSATWDSGAHAGQGWCLEESLIVIVGGRGSIGVYWAEIMDAAEHPMHGTFPALPPCPPPPADNYTAQNSKRARVGNSTTCTSQSGSGHKSGLVTPFLLNATLHLGRLWPYSLTKYYNGHLFLLPWDHSKLGIWSWKWSLIRQFSPNLHMRREEQWCSGHQVPMGVLAGWTDVRHSRFTEEQESAWLVFTHDSQESYGLPW